MRYASSRDIPASISASRTCCEKYRPCDDVHVAAHALRIDDEPVDDLRDLRDREVGDDRRVDECDALDRRLRDVAFVPGLHALELRLREAAQQTGEPGQPLAPPRVALVRHRRRPLLGALLERLLGFAHLRAREMPDLDREAFDRRTDEREERDVLGVTVAVGDLRRCGLGLQSERVQHVLLDGRRDARVAPDRSGHRPDGHASAIGRQRSM